MVANNLDQPVQTAFAPGFDNLTWVVEKSGTIRVIWDGFNTDPVLDLRDQVETGFWEQGLLSMAFHPDADEQRVFVLYTPPSIGNASDAEDIDDPWRHRIALAEYPYPYPDDWLVNATQETILFDEPKPKSQHNGGDLQFGPDGHLYVSVGEGGFGELSQQRDNLFGSILRLDVSEPGGYSVPPDNPFTKDHDARDEVWQYGFRNPWRIGFDSVTHDLWVGDVGASVREEINRIPLDRAGGNYGWDLIEGDTVRVDHDVDRTQYADPVYAYDTHGEDEDGRARCAVVGGFVYHGKAIPGLQGSYVFSDLCSEAVYALKEDLDGEWQEHLLVVEHRGIASIDPDPAGEILVVNHDQGTVRRIVPNFDAAWL